MLPLLLAPALAALPAGPALPAMMPLPPMLPMLPMMPQFLSAMPLLALGGRYGTLRGSGPFGRTGYPLQLGPVPPGMDGKDDESQLKRAAYLSGLTSSTPHRGARGQNLKRFYGCSQAPMPGLIVPLGALRAMDLVK